MNDAAAPAHPHPGDYVVVYQPRTPYGNPRLALVRVTEQPTPVTIRATFTSAEDAGPRFEEQGRLMAAGTGKRCFRLVDGSYTLLDALLADLDA